VTNPRLRLASGLALAYSLALLGDQMLYVYLPSHPAAAGIAAASLGVILSANRFVRLAANSLAGLLSDRLGRSRPYLLGMGLAVVSTAGYLAADGFWLLVFSRVLWGMAFALIHVGGAAIMLDLSTEENRGRTIGGYQAMARLGTLLGLLLSGFLTDWIGYRATLALYVPLAVLGLGIAALVLRGWRPPRASPAPAERGSRPGTLAVLRRLDPRLLAPAYVNFTTFFAMSGLLASTLGMQLASLAGSAGLAHPGGVADGRPAGRASRRRHGGGAPRRVSARPGRGPSADRGRGRARDPPWLRHPGEGRQRRVGHRRRRACGDGRGADPAVGGGVDRR
jgi:MFS family permease